MVNVKNYKPEQTDYLSVDILKEITDRRAVILESGTYETFEYEEDDGSKKQEQKPVVPVEVAGEKYTWVLNKTTCEKLSEEFESDETEDWVGQPLKLMIQKSGRYSYITATKIPQGDA